MDYCVLNGSLIKKEKATVSIDNRGLLFGDGLFETIRINNNQPLFFQHHLERLQRGCDFLNIIIHQEQIKKSFLELIKINNIAEGFARLTVTRGVTGRGIYPENQEGTYFITSQNRIPYNEESYEKGLSAAIVTPRRNPLSPSVNIKSLNYLDNIIAKGEARKMAVDEGLFLNIYDQMAEGTIANLFIVHNDTLMTPPLDTGLLPGIARKRVIEIAKARGIEVIEKNFNTDYLEKCSEAFLTNALMTVMPLTKFEGVSINKGRPGKITLDIHKYYL